MFDILYLLKKLFVYGCIGVLVEFFFTATYSLLTKNWKGTGYSYIWMPFIYGPTALGLELVRDCLSWPFYLKAFVYVPIIYGAEALGGWILLKIIGANPWDYKKSLWTPMGLVNFKYAPFWLLLGMAFEPIAAFLGHALKVLTSIAG